MKREVGSGDLERETSLVNVFSPLRTLPSPSIKYPWRSLTFCLNSFEWLLLLWLRRALTPFFPRGGLCLQESRRRGVVGRTLCPQQHTGVGWISSLEQLPLSSEQPRGREEGLS